MKTQRFVTKKRMHHHWRVGLVAMIGVALSSTAIAQGGQEWSVSGNSISAGDHIGTTNNEDLVFKTNGVETMRLTAAGLLGIGTATPTVPFTLLSNDDVSAGLHNIAVMYRTTPGAGNAGMHLLYEADGVDVTRNILRFPGVHPTTFQNSLSGGGIADVMHFDNNGNVGIGTTAPAASLEVVGTFKLADGTQQAGHYLSTDANGNASWQALPTVPTTWLQSGNNIYYNAGNVGIGTHITEQKLHVRGNAIVRNTSSHTSLYIEGPGSSAQLRMKGNIYNTGTKTWQWHVSRESNQDQNAYMGLDLMQDDYSGIILRNLIKFQPSGTITMNTTKAGTANVVVKGDNDDHLLMTNASTDKVGIGTDTPGEKLTVAGTIESTNGGIKFPDGTVQTTAFSSSGGNYVFDELRVNHRLHLGMNSLTYEDPSVSSTGKHEIWTDDEDLLFNSTPGHHYNTILNANGNNGSVGVGVSVPDAKMDVRVTQSNTHTAGLRVIQPLFAPSTLVDLFMVGNGPNSGGDYGTFFNVHKNGSVGIGASNDGSGLEATKVLIRAQNNPNRKSLKIENGFGNNFFFVNNLGNGGYNYHSKAGDLGLFFSDDQINNDAAGLVIAPREGSWAGLRMAASGHVAMGLKDPESKLHIRDGYLTIDGTSTTPIPEQNWHGWQTRIASPVNSAWVTTSKNYDDKYMCIGMTNSGFYFGVGDHTIGDANGSSANIKYPFYVSNDGRAVAREVLVTVNDGWWDEVFEPEYDLRPLSEVEDFIAANKHLPDVPSESEVMEGGINLGSMDAVLLRKIEELTLYILEQEKDMESLKTEMAALKASTSKK